MKIKSAFLLGPALLLSSTLFAQAQGLPTAGPTATPTPMTEKEVVTELKKDGADQLLKDLNRRGVDFEMDADIEKQLRKAKATDEVIKAVKAAGPKERAAAAKANAMASGQVPPEENADFTAVKTELDPDKDIALAEAYVKKFPQSPVLSWVYAYEANAYREKNDVGRLVEYGEKSLALKNDNLMSLMIVCYAMPSTQFVKLHQADEENQLTKAEDYTQKAVQAVNDLKKPTTMADADLARLKADYLAELHADMGMIHLDRAQLGLMGLDQDELAKSEKEYRLAISGTDHPDPTYYFRLGDACRLQDKLDDAIAAFSKASELGQGVIRQYADQEVEQLKKAKARSAAPKP